MKIATFILPVLLLPIVLAGCENGSSRMSYDATFDRIEGIERTVGDQDWTDPALLPTSGTAQYEGGIYLDSELNGSELDGYHDIAGEMQMTVDFGSDTPLSGSATNLVDENNRVYDGTLVMSDSVWDESFGDALVYRADLNGELTDQDGTTYDVETALDGSFVGESHEHVSGFIGGDACAGEDCSVIEGGLIGEKR